MEHVWQTSDFADDQFILVNEGKGEPALSILMPLFQQAAFVTDAINSVLRQESVTAEIIISDDCSRDDTFATALACISEALANGGVTHRIVMRRGGSRLWRDHLALLVDHAQCDIVCQAHGDDVSYPYRAAAVMLCARHYKTSAMFVSVAKRAGHIDLESHEFPKISFPLKTAPLPMMRALSRTMLSVGSGLAWRRSALAAFGRLDSRVAPTSHDRILTFRAALSGGVIIIDTPLYIRRMHEGSAANRYFETVNGSIRTRLSTMIRERMMLADAGKALSLGLISSDVHEDIVREIGASRMRELDALLDEYHERMSLGQDVMWTKKDD